MVQAAFLEGPQMVAVTADSRGRLIAHNVSQYLSLTAILAGALQPIHLAGLTAHA